MGLFCATGLVTLMLVAVRRSDENNAGHTDELALQRVRFKRQV